MSQIRQILGYRNLIGLITKVNGGVPTDILPAEFFNLTVGVEGDAGEYDRHSHTREPARRSEYGARARERAQIGIEKVQVKLLHTVEQLRHKPATLLNLREPGGTGRQRLGKQEIARQTMLFGMRFNNLRAAAVYSMLANGEIYFDADGNLAAAAVAGGHAVDYKVPADHKGDLGGLITASWATASTDIQGHVEDIKDRSVEDSGLPVSTVYYGANIPKYLCTNNCVKEYLKANSGLSAALTQSTIPDGLFGLNWRKVNGAFFEDHTGAVQRIFDGDYCGFTPNVGREWYELLEGTYPVPTTIGGAFADAEDAIDSFDTVQGMFSYATVEGNPPAIEHVAGDTFLPALKVPTAVYLADVTP